MAKAEFLNDHHPSGASLLMLAGAPSGGRSGCSERRRAGVAGRAEAKRAKLRCRMARAIASAVLAVSVEDIARPNRSNSDACQARHVAIYLAHVVFQVPLTAIASHFGRDRTSVAYAIRRVEDARDDAGYEALIARMERLSAACLEFSGARSLS